MTFALPLEPLTRLADPLADRTVSAIIGPWNNPAGPGPGPQGMERLAQATRLMAQWGDNASLADWQPAGPAPDPSVLQALRRYLHEGSVLPDWTDARKVARAETIFMEEGPLSCTLLFCASLPECYVPPRLAEVLHIAGQLEAHTEHRIRQTAAMVFPVMLKGGLTDGAGCGIAQVLKVRLIHATIRHLILHGDPEGVRGAVAPSRRAASAASAHAALTDALLTHGWDVARHGLPCNQFELAYTLLTFHFVFLRGMRTLGLRLKKDDEEALLHTWNVAGHVLGVRDELMPFSYDEAAEQFGQMQAFGRAQPGDADARPGLGRTLVRTLAQTIRLPVIRDIPVPLTQRLIGRQSAGDIGIGSAAPLLTRWLFAVGWVVIRAVDGTARLFLPDFSLSRLFGRVIGYHVLDRFLLDQTRPLVLPEQVLNPMRVAIASWHDDPRAPAWQNRLEDRWTTRGPWGSHPGSGDARQRKGPDRGD